MFVVILSLKALPGKNNDLVKNWNALTSEYIKTNMLLDAYIVHSNFEYISISIWESEQSYSLCNGIFDQNSNVCSYIENINKCCYNIEIKHKGKCLNKNI